MAPHPGQRMSRIPDVGNPWLDAGIVGFSTLKYNQDRKYWEQWYPADFITESFPGQFRNWFYALLAMSTMMSDGRRPFKTLLGHGNVRDQLGHEMHKSAGNSIEFVGAAESGYTIDFELKDGVSEKTVNAILGITQETKDAGKLLKEAITGIEAAEYGLLERVLKASVERKVVDKERTGPNGVEKYRAVRASYCAMAADVIRWVYCRQEPAANIRFGPITADEVRSKVFFKLWNTYAMFCNYATGDGFDPSTPAVPVAERPDFDRWLISNLQNLVWGAKVAYESYDVMTFALRCEEFIDGDLSNWYVRRNKDRLHSKNADLDDAGRKDKLAAYQTLYTTLTTLCKLMAPCIPFVTEEMWRNLRRQTDPESVHLCDFPRPDNSLEDVPLSQDMAAVRDVITLGLSARQTAKINVRQPLATLVVSPGPDVARRAVERFPDLIADELNVEAVLLHAEATPLLKVSAKLNKKTAASKLGAKLKEAEDALAKMTPAELDAKPFVLVGVTLDVADVVREYAAQPGWCGAADKGTQVALCTTIDDELKDKGRARDIIRQVQSARKDAKLDLLDKIALHLGTTSPELAKAIAAHRDAIATAVQATQWSDTPLTGEGVHTANVKIDGQPLTIMLRKV